MAYRISDGCLGCGTCMDSCPNDAIIEGDAYQIDPEKCESCGTCADLCPAGAIVEE